MSRPAYDTLTCLVSEQAIPNLTPALDARYRPARVVLVVSNDSMAQRAAWLGRVLDRHGLPHETVRLTAPDDFAAMLADFRAIVTRHPDAALNATGGKKTMTLAAFRAFAEAGRPAFYVERDNRLQWLEPAGDAHIPLATVLSLDDLLTAHGQEIVDKRTRIDPRVPALAALLMDDPDQQKAAALTELGYFGADEMKEIRPKDGAPFDKRHRALLDTLQRMGFVRQQGKSWLCAKSDAALLAGAWLEQHTWHVIHELPPKLGVRDTCHGLRLASASHPDVKNEIDVAFVRDNRLYLIECKALKPQGPARDRKKNKGIADFIYTLESVRKSGGLAARAALLTWGTQPGPSDAARAEDNGIRILAGATLNNLELALATWVASV